MMSYILQVLRDVEVEIPVEADNQRVKYPTSYFYPGQRKIRIVANKPSLIRYALAHLILHELSEAKFHEQYGEVEDTHQDPRFIKILAREEIKLDKLICDEHD